MYVRFLFFIFCLVLLCNKRVIYELKKFEKRGKRKKRKKNSESIFPKIFFIRDGSNSFKNIIDQILSKNYVF